MSQRAAMRNIGISLPLSSSLSLSFSLSVSPSLCLCVSVSLASLISIQRFALLLSLLFYSPWSRLPQHVGVPHCFASASARCSACPQSQCCAMAPPSHLDLRVQPSQQRQTAMVHLQQPPCVVQHLQRRQQQQPTSSQGVTLRQQKCEQVRAARQPTPKQKRPTHPRMIHCRVPRECGDAEAGCGSMASLQCAGPHYLPHHRVPLQIAAHGDDDGF